MALNPDDVEVSEMICDTIYPAPPTEEERGACWNIFKAKRRLGQKWITWSHAHFWYQAKYPAGAAIMWRIVNFIQEGGGPDTMGYKVRAAQLEEAVERTLVKTKPISLNAEEIWGGLYGEKDAWKQNEQSSDEERESSSSGDEGSQDGDSGHDEGIEIQEDAMDVEGNPEEEEEEEEVHEPPPKRSPGRPRKIKTGRPGRPRTSRAFVEEEEE